jgi:hypothetical protein
MVISLRQELPQSPETSESKSRRLLFDRVRQSLSDLMMTADEKNHVISNANEELDRQVIRLDTVFPYIAGEISGEARLGSLTHWAYSNKSAAKAATNERPRREAVSHRQDLSHVLHEAEAASRSEARRDAVMARKQRRAHVDADYEETRGSGARKTNNGKSRGGDHAADPSVAPKRRKVERPPLPVDASVPMERSASGATSQRVANKEPAEKKRSRAPNPTAAARKKYAPTSQLITSNLTDFVPGPMPPMLDPPFWLPHHWLEHSMPRAVPPAQDQTLQGRNLHAPSKMREQQATHAHGHRLRLQTDPTAVCHFNYLRRIYSLTTFPTQTKSPIPDLQSGTDLSKVNLATQTHIAASMKTLIPEHPFQWVPSVRIRTERLVLPRPTRLRDAIPRPLPPFFQDLQSPVNAHGLHEARTLHLPNALRKNLSRSLLYPLMTSRSMRVTMKMKKASLGTATVMRSVSVRWLLAIMMPVRVNGSTCRVWG